jgi:uncharacterized protein (DUF1330 family)
VAIILNCMLWAHPGREAELVAYEDAVLDLLGDHGARLLSRVRSDGADGHPLEVQLFEFPTQDALDAYLADPRRVALAPQRDAAVARTELMPVDIVN